MSYNISAFEIVDISDFRIPADFTKHFDYEIETEQIDSECTEYQIGESTAVFAKKISEDWLEVQSINICSEGSGWDLDTFERYIFPKSTGKLIAFLVWEGGDSYTLLNLENGKYTNERIDIARVIKKYLELMVSSD